MSLAVSWSAHERSHVRIERKRSLVLHALRRIEGVSVMIETELGLRVMDKNHMAGLQILVRKFFEVVDLRLTRRGSS